ncbi:hypothetical protein [Thermogutta sp.]|jgi:hypothetical protein|uniref:hypothetical protein n=1 Tax=Thermogutta sp. TaxID=1962930 RepID=UPI00321F80B0
MNRSGKTPHKGTGSQLSTQAPGKAEREAPNDPPRRQPDHWERIRLGLMSVVLFLWIAALVALAVLTP